MELIYNCTFCKTASIAQLDDILFQVLPGVLLRQATGTLLFAYFTKC